jgi:hypothetical protein
MLVIRKRIVVDSAVWTEELDRKPLASETGYPPSFIAPMRQIKEVEQNNINGNIVTAIEGELKLRLSSKNGCSCFYPCYRILIATLTTGDGP